MSDVKRYAFYDGDDVLQTRAIEDDDGEWERHADAQAAREADAREIVRLEALRVELCRQVTVQTEALAKAERGRFAEYSAGDRDTLGLGELLADLEGGDHDH